MKKIYTFILSFSIITFYFTHTLNAQVASSYNFSQTSGSYTGLVGATVLGNPFNDDNTFPQLPIGFNFNYNGAVYTQFSVNTNGYIVLGNSNSNGSSSAVLSDVTNNVGGSINNSIAALSEDLVGQNSSMLWYQTQGNSNNHILVVEWKNYNMYNALSSAPGSGNALNFQIQLFETSNKIQVIYGTMVADTMPLFMAEIGLRGNSNSDFNNRKVNANNIWSASIPGTLNTDLCELSNALHPTTGLTYTWTRTSVGVESLQSSVTGFFDVYPNPSKGTIKVSVPLAHIENCTINIYNMEGKSVYTVKDTNISGNYSKVISTIGIAKGVYYIKLETEGGADVKKLVIQ